MLTAVKLQDIYFIMAIFSEQAHTKFSDEILLGQRQNKMIFVMV